MYIHESVVFVYPKNENGQSVQGLSLVESRVRSLVSGKVVGMHEYSSLLEEKYESEALGIRGALASDDSTMVVIPGWIDHRVLQEGLLEDRQNMSKGVIVYLAKIREGQGLVRKMVTLYSQLDVDYVLLGSDTYSVKQALALTRRKIDRRMAFLG